MKKMLFITLPLLLAIARGSWTYSQTNVSGDITANTTWLLANSPYRVTGPVRIVPLVTLTVEPGVEVMFDPGTRLTVEGVLDARGTLADSVFFFASTPGADTSAWSGVEISGSVGGFARMAYCKVSNAADAIRLTGSVTATHLEMKNSFIERSARAVSGWVGSQETIRKCRLSENYIAMYNSEMTVSRCAFDANEFGIVNSVVAVDSSTFSNHFETAVSGSAGTIRNSLFIANHVGLAYFASSPVDSVTGCQFAENDTALVLDADMPAIFENEICANFVNVKVATPSDISIGSNCWCSTDSAQIASLVVDGNTQGNLGLLSFMPIMTGCSVNSQVWPGDTDDDGGANVTDLLHIGVAYQFTGDPRVNPTMSWIGQAGLPWDGNFDTGLNYKHADCDGNGIVDFNDIQSVMNNYGQGHLKTNWTPATSGPGIPLIFEVPSSANAGDTILINVYLGESADPAVNVYGVSFGIEFDTTVIQVSSPVRDLTGTWLGNPSSNLLDLFVNDGKANWAIVKNDHMDTTGFGKLGGVTMIMIDDLNRIGPAPLEFAVGNVALIGENGEMLDVDVQIVQYSHFGVEGLTIFPNPSSGGELRIMLDTLVANEVAVYGPGGMTTFLIEGESTGTVVVNTANYVPGMYFVRVRVGNGILTRKIIIR